MYAAIDGGEEGRPHVSWEGGRDTWPAADETQATFLSRPLAGLPPATR